MRKTYYTHHYLRQWKINVIRTICITFIIIVLFFSTVQHHLFAQEVVSKKSESTRVAVLNFTTNNTPEHFSRIVRNIMEVTIFATGELQLLEWEHIQKMIKGTRFENKSDFDVTDSIELGSKLNADFLIVGSIDKIDDYRITTRVISMAEQKILMAYSRKFSSAGDADSVAEKMAQDISRDIGNYMRTGKVQRRFYDVFRIKLLVGGEYIQPMGTFHSLVNSGYGLTFTGDVENVFIEHLFFGIGTGYYHFTGRETTSDSCFVVPLYLNAGYIFYLHRRLFIFPVLSPGMILLSLKHGSNDGFDMRPESERTYTEPLILMGFSVGVMPVQSFDLRFSARYGYIFEPGKSMHFFSFGFGFCYIF